MSNKSWADLEIEEIREIKKIETIKIIPKISQTEKIINSNIQEIQKTQETVLLENMLYLINIIKQNIFESILYLEWISNVSAYLANKYKLSITLHNMIPNNIPRNSYRFCNYGSKCITHYHKKKKCNNGHHFVHNYVKEDIDQIIFHIKNNKQEDIKIKEINISLNTINFVLNHMYDELISKTII